MILIFNYIYRKRSRRDSAVKKITVNSLIFLIKLLIFTKQVLSLFFVSIVFKPARVFLNFFFNTIIVKAYCKYTLLIRKFGWKSTRDVLSSLFSNQKFIHILVLVLTFLVVFLNFTSKTKAGMIGDKTSQTIIANLVSSEFGHIEDEELIEEYFSEVGVKNIARSSYVDNKGIIQSQPKAVIDSEEEFYEDQLVPIVQDGTALVKQGKTATKKTKQPRSETIKYVIQGGDTVSTIAEKFDISVNTILWENSLSAYSLIRPGNELSILPMTGIGHRVKSGENLGRIASRYGVEEEKIIEINNITKGDILKIGQSLMIPDGRKSRYSSVASSRYSGVSAIKDLVAPPPSRQVASNKMAWPTPGHRITQYYSWRHHGLDIADKTGTPLYAADSGTVTFAGWGKGYGYNIVIDHGGGKKTRYAHCSKFYVKKGTKVSKGQTIAGMGSTGWSTGPHIHFEVIINGKKYNPLNYIK